MCWTCGGFHMKECSNKGKTSTSKLPTCWNIEKCEHYGVLTNILIIKMVKENEDMKEATISQTRSMTKAKVVVWPLNEIHFLGLRNFTSTLATSQKLEENKVTTQHSTNVPTYPKSNSILGFFCGSKICWFHWCSPWCTCFASKTLCYFLLSNWIRFFNYNYIFQFTYIRTMRS